MTSSSSNSSSPPFRWYVNRLNTNCYEIHLDVLKVKDWFSKNGIYEFNHNYHRIFLCLFIDKTSVKFFYSFNEYIKYLEVKG